MKSIIIYIICFVLTVLVSVVLKSIISNGIQATKSHKPASKSVQYSPPSSPVQNNSPKSEPFIGVLQYSYPSGITQTLFQTEISDEQTCKVLNENHWKGVKTANQNWKLDYMGCTTTMPRGYEPLLDNNPISLPYMSSERDRIVFSGVSYNQVVEACKEMANIYASKLKRPGVCIYNNSPN